VDAGSPCRLRGDPHQHRRRRRREDDRVVGEPGAAARIGDRAIVIGVPPATATFLSLLSAKKAIQRPSGEKNG
jgi:hypothetical protein